MNYKLIATDMDGTRLDREGKIPETTAAAVQKLVESGVIFTLSTGRPIQGIEKYIEQLHLKGPMITYNGAEIVDAETHRILYKKDLLLSDAERIFSLGQRFGTNVIIWGDGRLFANNSSERIVKYCERVSLNPVVIKDMADLGDVSVTKILWADEAETIARVQEEIAEESFNEVTFCTSTPRLLEFFNKNVSKAEAMRRIGEMCGITREEMIAVGDGQNDISMIQYAGLGVAMENASDEVKSHADYITASHREEGVLRLIEKFFG